ncbi:Hypothetical predicted protein [Mytilus galloprovincialis]|uniref:Uncharacterized protein n=1 Tax=Mytilus galloprovincialis TaxID=29158 RepID=A0A8B6FVW7_MYTGA|nr:Hypothetical predicted protein [Mytilus galloprovincialis]
MSETNTSNRGNCQEHSLQGNTETTSCVSETHIGNVHLDCVLKQIIDGKDEINLASLLIPNYESPQVHSVAANGMGNTEKHIRQSGVHFYPIGIGGKSNDAVIPRMDQYTKKHPKKMWKVRTLRQIMESLGHEDVSTNTASDNGIVRS